MVSRDLLGNDFRSTRSREIRGIPDKAFLYL